MRSVTFDTIIKRNAWQECVTPKVWDGMFKHSYPPAEKHYKISLCTTCMDRLDDLKQTLHKNIQDNAYYFGARAGIEYLILDYGSKRDNVYQWAKHFKDDGVVVYRIEVDSYSMAHSRNVAFRLAIGDIVVNVDADGFTNVGFAEYLNRIASETTGTGVVFAKGKRMLRGRVGFFKHDFINLLGGYNEQLQGYGHDDHDILHRAYGLGFTLYWFGGKYYDAVPNHKKHKVENYKKSHRDWRYTECMNKAISFANLAMKRFKANEHAPWGCGTVIKNESEEIVLS